MPVAPDYRPSRRRLSGLKAMARKGERLVEIARRMGVTKSRAHQLLKSSGLHAEWREAGRARAKWRRPLKCSVCAAPYMLRSRHSTPRAHCGRGECPRKWRAASYRARYPEKAKADARAYRMRAKGLAYLRIHADAYDGRPWSDPIATIRYRLMLHARREGLPWPIPAPG